MHGNPTVTRRDDRAALRRTALMSAGGCALLGWLALVAMAPGLSCGPSSLRHGHSVPGRVHETGPPPHAPAHGYRHRHQRDGVELVFDAGRGVYVVVGLPACYFLDGIYYRRVSQQWEMAIEIEGDWTAVARDGIPAGLRSEDGKTDAPPGARGKASGKSHGHGHGTP
ncbi:MAG: hypothetical protein PVF43_06140 [Candidatus Eiseniibacteriota bacterium]|jgi:hypothetical protein